MAKPSLAIFDLDAMLHTVANVQFSAGNTGNAKAVKQNISRFINSIKASCKCDRYVMFYQIDGHQNYRKEILPEYKGHRTSSDAIKCWKPTICEAFAEEGAIGLQYIESDDACSVVAEHYGYKNCVIVTSDKDMAQVPCTQYNPFKRSTPKKPIKPEDRWTGFNFPLATRFFWAQVLAGDSTDMPNEQCGIMGVGISTAYKRLDAVPDDQPYLKTIQQEYTRKYGAAEGRKRAVVTYQMVRLLRLSGNEYAPVGAQDEVRLLVDAYPDFINTNKSGIEDLFDNAPKKKFDPTSLFAKDKE